MGNKKSAIRTMQVIVFFLLYYVYMNAIRKVMIPMDNITIPLILAITLFIVLKRSHAKTHWTTPKIKAVALSWIIICIYIFINNASFFDQLVHGGMIHLYVLVSFMLYVSYDSSWFGTWIKWTKIYALFYAVTTIIFYFTPSLYFKFAQFMFPETISSLTLFYNYGWMCGICDHFSTNGMVLATGLMICFNEILSNKKQGNIRWKHNKFLYVSICLILYALILSSKRAPLIASFVAIFMTYIVSSPRNISKRIFILCLFGAFLMIIYEFLLPYIPGLSTIADKFQSTQESDGGVLQGREVLWAVAYDMISSAPILGHGFGSYSYITEKMEMFTTSTHNYYLQMFAELGIVGLLLYVAAFIFGIQLTVRQLRKMSLRGKNVSYTDMLILKISLSLQIFVILYNLSASAMMYYPILIPYFLAVTAACILTRKYRFIEQKS